MKIIAPSWKDYELVDSGLGEKLERFGPFLLRRPAPQALWRPEAGSEAWDRADALFVRTATGGDWTFYRPLPPEGWTVGWGAFSVRLRPTPLGHIGLFPEQAPNWEWVARRPGPVLNLFGYTGLMTLAAAQAGSQVCHVDASKPAVTWARENAAQSGLGQAPIRWIVDDVPAFLKREGRRGNRYRGIILDPPTFGRGPSGQVFKLEEHLLPLLESCLSLLAPNPAFLVLTSHTSGITDAVLANLLQDLVRQRGGQLEAGEILQQGGSRQKPLPSGMVVRWSS